MIQASVGFHCPDCVKGAKQAWEFHMNRLGEMMADLPKAELVAAAVCALLVFCYRVNSAWVIVGAAVAGVLFSIFH